MADKRRNQEMMNAYKDHYVDDRKQKPLAETLVENYSNNNTMPLDISRYDEK